MPEPQIVTTDARSRAVLPGKPNRMYVRRDFEDGSILLEPARVVTHAQAEYDADPNLRDLLDRAATSPTVRRNYERK